MEQTSIPAGRKLCPTCNGQGVVGVRTRDPQDETSDDCPTCAPVDAHGRRTDSASLGHVAR